MKLVKSIHKNIQNEEFLESSLTSDAEVYRDLLEDGRRPLVDSSIDSKRMLKIKKKGEIYTAVGVADEGKWSSLDDDHTLKSATIGEIRNNNNSEIITLGTSAEDNDKPKSTVNLHPLNDTVNCASCGAPVRREYLTSSNFESAVYVCQNLSKNDQRILVLAVVFPKEFILITNDHCLGWSSASLGSYSLEEGIYWGDYFKLYD